MKVKRSVGSLIFNPIRLQVAPDNSVIGGKIAVVGVPVPQSLSTDPAELCVCRSDNQCVPSAINVTSRWSDGSIRWCLVKFVVSSADSVFFLDLRHGRPDAVYDPLKITHKSELTVAHKEISYCFREGHGFPEVCAHGEPYIAPGAKLSISDKNGQPGKCVFEPPVLASHDNLSALVVSNGQAVFNDGQTLRVFLKHRLSADGHYAITVGLHNPQRARHSEGIWDLGDPGSVLIERLELEIPLIEAGSILLQSETAQQWQSPLPLSLYQASSGGEHWQSPVHVNRNNVCRNEFCGYRMAVGQEEIQAGSRAEPAIIATGRKASAVAIVPRDFWQNFPSSIEINNTSVKLGIFAPISSDCHEIQGGERKQHTFDFYFSNDTESLKKRVDSNRTSRYVMIDREAFENAQVLGNAVGPTFDGYDKLLELSLDETQGFFAKREQQDEFGWRNFGDVVADHETLYHDDNSYFISHYNNQYDCIYGFARQYLLTGDCRWFQLMDELARHVVDIDIYHTDQDRAEYNHGLFWHTDHYRKASTASHRTYSKDHYPEDWTGPRGGGPGPEHCYTSGLKVYFFLTGNTDARDAVIGMTQWITHYYDGTGTLIEFCKSLLSTDVKNLIAVLRGSKVFRYPYPFDRGVGNYVRALLDCYEISAEQHYLVNAERVIVNTFGPEDDIAMRDLEDIERTWFYTVFLQEVSRFLDIKRVENKIDNGFVHARDGLLHYARWMAWHEMPYLEQPDKLEYPNDTWAAQEIRKANVLYSAYLYADDERQQLLSRARFHRDHVVQSLGQSNTLHFARIQALLLQNHGPAGLMEAEMPCYHAATVSTPAAQRDSLYKISDFLPAVRSGLLKVIRTSNPLREYEWVRTRLGR